MSIGEPFHPLLLAILLHIIQTEWNLILRQGLYAFSRSSSIIFCLINRPCYYQGKGRLKGSYVRISDSDEPMTEYEVYSYEAFRQKYQDDIRNYSKEE